MVANRTGNRGVEAAVNAQRRIAGLPELDCDAIGRLIVDEALRRTLNDLARRGLAGMRGSRCELAEAPESRRGLMKERGSLEELT